jgi:hypothetical protein
MLSKCTNLGCSAVFRYLEGGRLFLLEEDWNRKEYKSGRFEYFWLCQDCSATMTLRLREDRTVAAVRLPEPLTNTDSDVASNWIERKRGLILHSVRSLLLKPIPRAGKTGRADRHGIPFLSHTNSATLHLPIEFET